ncbi:MAG: type I pullulanase [Fimbriimonadaceae bacterium]|nr:type I pullulanase [Fimbriimonadaceae bacterium]
MTSLLAAALLVSTQSASLPPAFLDSPSRVTVALESAGALPSVSGVTVTLDGNPLVINSVAPGTPAARPRDPNRVVLPGSIQRALGGNEWDPNGAVTEMTKTADGQYRFEATFPAGAWEYKVAKGGSWDQNWGRDFISGGPNIPLVVARDGTNVRFLVNFNEGWVRDSINHPDFVDTPTTVAARQPEQSSDLLDSVVITLNESLTAKAMTGDLRVSIGDETRRIYLRDVLNDGQFLYPREDLGVTIRPQSMTFKVWSPPSKSATLLYGNPPRRIPMTRGTAGVWYVTVNEVPKWQPYRFEFNSYGERRIASDIYGKASTKDSMTSVVVDVSRTNPEVWPPKPLPFSGKATDAVIYEFHVRDLTASPSSGVPEHLRGKYLGLALSGTTLPGTDIPTGLDYLKSLGITHAHLLPVHDFNPDHSNDYNWGYETTQFNVPEEQYAVGTHPTDPIIEFKTVVASLARNGIGTVMDVVYNHSVPSQGERSAFWQSVPYFYFRTNDRGEVLNESGVGNALADERPMVRKFIRDSLVYWTKEYQVAGFRFDLLGMHTPESVADWARAVRAVNPDALIYGEPWTGGGPLRFPKGSQVGLNVGVFNDHFRGTVRGNLDEPGPGLMNGSFDENGLKRALSGSIDYAEGVKDFAAQPGESVNYVSAHDNLTLMDRIGLEADSYDQRMAAARLAFSTVLLSQGVPFIEGGSEMGRTKGGNHNSYNGGDLINQYNWEAAPRFADMTNFVRGLIDIRRAHPAFRMSDAEQIRQNLRFPVAEPGLLVVRIDGASVGDSWREILILINSGEVREFGLPEGSWSIAVMNDLARNGSIGSANGRWELPGHSATVLYR